MPPGPQIATDPLDIVSIVNLFIAGAILVAIILSVYYIFVGSISFILSGGDEGKIKDAMNTIRYAIIGLLLTIFSIAFIYLLGKLLFNVDLSQYINPDRMTDMIRRLFERIVN